MRKFYIILSILLIAAMLLVACGKEETPEVAEEAPVAEEAVEEEAEEGAAAGSEGIAEAGSETEEEVIEVSQYSEAPMLADLVASGELPPVEERLPVNPMVLEPNPDYNQVIGTYGGEIVTVTGSSSMSNIKMWLADGPIRWKEDLTGYRPGMASKYEWSEDAKTFTLYFREGLKWSDGEPFTMEDMEFWWVDNATNPDVAFVTVPWYLWNHDTYDDEGNLTPCDVSFPDDYSMQWVCDTPIPVAPYILAQGFWEWEPLITPKHYLKDFHPTYNPDATFEDLEYARQWWNNPDMPTMMAWHVYDYSAGQYFKLERNPYYWKVDSEGNQLPYVDKLYVEVVDDGEIRTLNLSQGKYDASFRGAGGRSLDFTFLYEQQEAGDYTMYTGWWNGAGAFPGLLVNQDYTGEAGDYTNMTAVDYEVRDLLRNKLFRRAISVAVDRDQICSVAWEGVCEPNKNFTISPQSWHFFGEEGQKLYDEWAYMYIDYDPEQAMAWLDEIGMVDVDGDGFRELPSGEPFQLIIDETCWSPQAVEDMVMPLVEEKLEAVGIDTFINMICGTAEISIRAEDQANMMIRTAHVSEVDIWTYPDWVFPMRGNRNWPMEGKYRATGGAEGWDPEGEDADGNAIRLQEFYDMAMVEPDAQKRHEIMWQAVREVHIAEGPFTIGLSGDQPECVVIKNGLKNVQDYGVLGPWAPATPGNTFPELWFWEQ